jgi:hypothetical protein
MKESLFQEKKEGWSGEREWLTLRKKGQVTICFGSLSYMT